MTAAMFRSRRCLRRGRPHEPAATRLRPLVPHTDGAVDEVFAGLSRRSRHLRFHSATPRLTGGARTALLAVDGHRHVALVAESAAGQAVGIARFVDRGTGRVDTAVAVVDAWQRRGVGRQLLRALGVRARELGHPALHGEVMRENVSALAMLRATFPGTRALWVDGVVRVTCPLVRSDAPVTDEEILGDLLS